MAYKWDKPSPHSLTYIHSRTPILLLTSHDHVRSSRTEQLTASDLSNKFRVKLRQSTRIGSRDYAPISLHWSARIVCACLLQFSSNGGVRRQRFILDDSS